MKQKYAEVLAFFLLIPVVAMWYSYHEVPIYITNSTGQRLIGQINTTDVVIEPHSTYRHTYREIPSGTKYRDGPFFWLNIRLDNGDHLIRYHVVVDNREREFDNFITRVIGCRLDLLINPDLSLSILPIEEMRESKLPQPTGFPLAPAVLERDPDEGWRLDDEDNVHLLYKYYRTRVPTSKWSRC